MCLLLRNKAKCREQPQKSALPQCLCCCETKQNATSNHTSRPYYNVSAVAKQANAKNNHKNRPYYNVSAVAKQSKMPQTTTNVCLASQEAKCHKQPQKFASRHCPGLSATMTTVMLSTIETNFLIVSILASSIEIFSLFH